MLESLTPLVLAVILLATVVRSAFGFGEALVAVPLLALLMPVETAAPLAALVSITVAGIVLVQDWADVQAPAAGWLVLSTLLGTPLGLLLLTQVPETAVKIILAGVIIGFATYCLVQKGRFSLSSDRFAWVFGFWAGVLGGAYGMNGPPLVVYGTLRGWSPSHFRATLQGYFLPASIVVMAGYWLVGLWTAQVSYYYVVSLPVVVVAILIGRCINRRLKSQQFLVAVHGGLIAIGIVLLLQALM